MANIQLPIKTELPVVEPLARAPRSTAASIAQPTFDDHLERAAQPADEPSSAQRNIENGASPGHESDHDQPTETAATDSTNDTNDSAQDEIGQESDAVVNETVGDDNNAPSKNEVADDEQPTSDEDASDAVASATGILTEQDSEQTNISADNSNTTSSAAAKNESVPDTKNVPPAEQTLDEGGRPSNNATTAAPGDVADTELAEPTRAAVELGTSDDADETDGRSQAAVTNVGDGKKITAANEVTSDSEDGNLPVTTKSKTPEQAESESQDGDETRKRDTREISRKAKSSSDSKTVSSSVSNTNSETPGSNEVVNDGSRGAGLPSAGNARQESTNVVSPATTFEGNSEPSTSSSASVDVAHGASSNSSTMSRIAARTTSHLEPAATNEGNLNEPQRVRFVQRVAGAFKAAGERDGTVRVRLSPPELGSLRLQVTVRQGAMIAQLETETPEARRLLLENLPELRDRLAQQDVKVERFDVNVRDEGREQLSERSHGDDGSRDQQSSEGSNDPAASGEDTDAGHDERHPATAADSDQLNIVI